MRYNVSDEVSKQLVELEIANRKEMLKLYDGVIETLAKFDGKIYSKRVETALKKNVSDRISVERSFNSLIIKYYYENRCVTYKNDGSEYTNCAYLKDTYDNFVHATCYSSYDDGCMADKDTIIFDKLKAQIVKTKEYMENSIVEMENALVNIDKIIREYEELKAKCDAFNSKKNWCISEYYAIKSFRTE